MVGTVSADTLLVYPAIDGYVRETTDAAYFTMRNDVGDGNTVGSTTALISPYISTMTTNGVYGDFRRGVFSFNTSTIPDDATINSGIFKTRGSGKTNGLGSPSYGITGGVLASNTSLANGDYDGFFSTRYSSDIAYNNISTNSDNNWTLNADGISGVSKTGFTVIFLRDSWDIDNSTTGLTWVSSTSTQISFYSVNAATEARRPYLEVVYTSGATPPVASFTTSKNFIRIPNTVTVTDTSTNTPTSWEWSWGDGTANSTTQNPTHQYLKRGKFDIYLTATNAGGSNTTAVTNVKVVGYENYY
jgi:PKD repeat protein